MSKAESLKTRVRLLLNKAVDKSKKRQSDIVKSTNHNKDYVSRMLNEDCNLSLDTVENVFKSLGFELNITLKKL